MAVGEAVLRAYQADLIQRARHAYKAGFKSVLLVLPTGGGKTILTGEILRGLNSRGNTGWWLEHRDELIEQSSNKFQTMGIDHALVQRGQIHQPDHQLQIASIQTITRRLDNLPPPDFLAFDEAHHSVAESWQRIIRKYPNTPRIGLTATPCRLDGRGLGKWYDTMIIGPSMAELIEMGYLAEYSLYVASNAIDESQLKVRQGEYTAKSQLAACDQPKRIGDIVQHYGDLAQGRKAICFAVSIDDSLNLVAAFNAAGIRAMHVDGETPADKRRAIFDEFKAGCISVLSNCDIFGEGVHAEGVSCVILGRKTNSLARYLQWCGRGMAPKDDHQTTLILDHAGNAGTISPAGFIPNHGMPDDPREWSLDDLPKRKRQTEPNTSVRLCPKCLAANRSGTTRCRYCGTELTQHQPTAVTVGTGKLVEVKPTKEQIKATQKQRYREEHACKSQAELHQLGKARGYKFPAQWAFRRWQQIRPRQPGSD